MGKVVAIIQARMGSSRLPGKVLKPIMGKPLLGYLLDRVKRVKGIQDIVLATTGKSEDDPIAFFAKTEGVTVFRGSEDDVLDRFYQAAKQSKADYIVRLTGDNPLVDPSILDQVVAEILCRNVDFVGLSPTFAEGLDCCIFRRKLLDEAWDNARLASEREHVTLYMHNNNDLYSFYRLPNTSDDAAIRITVDEPQDFEVVTRIVEALYSKDRFPSFPDIKEFLLENPTVLSLNSTIIRNEGLVKSLLNDSKCTKP